MPLPDGLFPGAAGRPGALPDAFQNDQQKLEKLRSTKVEGDGRGKLEDLLKTADAKLRARLTLALNDTAALTLGREGAEGSAKPSGSPKAEGSAKPSGSPDVKVAFSADAQLKVDAIVAAAIADMDKIVADATSAVTALPTFTPGKPSDAPGGKPSNAPSGKPSDLPGGKPSDAPGGKPSDAPGGKPSDAPGGAPSAKPTR